MPTNRRRVGRAGGSVITPRALELYREGLAASYERRIGIHFELHAELSADACLPSLLRDAPVFLLAVPDEGPYRELWAELKAELEAALEAANAAA